MKKIFFLATAALLFQFAAVAQNTDRTSTNADQELKNDEVPEAVRSALQSQFPKASDIEWKMKEGNYKATFDVKRTDHFAEITSSGEIVSKGTEIKNRELPVLISDAIKKAYPQDKIDDVFRVEKGGSTYYLVELDGDPDKKLLYDAQGRLSKEKNRE